MADAARDTRQQAGEQRRKARRDSLVESDTARRKRVRPKPGGAYRYSDRQPQAGDDFLDSEPALQPIDQQKSAEYTNYQDKYDPRKQKLQTSQERKRQQKANVATKQQVTQKLRTITNQQARLAQQEKIRKKEQIKNRTAKKKASRALKLTTWVAHFGLTSAQIWFGLFVIAGMAAGGIIGGVLDIIGFDSDEAASLLYAAFVLTIAVGWMKLMFITFILLFAGTKPLWGTRAEIKLALFLVAFVAYSLPILQMFPVSIIWTWYVFRHPN